MQYVYKKKTESWTFTLSVINLIPYYYKQQRSNQKLTIIQIPVNNIKPEHDTCMHFYPSYKKEEKNKNK